MGSSSDMPPVVAPVDPDELVDDPESDVSAVVPPVVPLVDPGVPVETSASPVSLAPDEETSRHAAAPAARNTANAAARNET